MYVYVYAYCIYDVYTYTIPSPSRPTHLQHDVCDDLLWEPEDLEPRAGGDGQIGGQQRLERAAVHVAKRQIHVTCSGGGEPVGKVSKAAAAGRRTRVQRAPQPA